MDNMIRDSTSLDAAPKSELEGILYLNTDTNIYRAASEVHRGVWVTSGATGRLVF
jgi:hypothetical protein